MKVELIKDTVVNGSVEWAGTVVSVDKETAVALINREEAKPVETAHANKKDK